MFGQTAILRMMPRTQCTLFPRKVGRVLPIQLQKKKRKTIVTKKVGSSESMNFNELTNSELNNLIDKNMNLFDI